MLAYECCKDKLITLREDIAQRSTELEEKLHRLQIASERGGDKSEIKQWTERAVQLEREIQVFKNKLEIELGWEAHYLRIINDVDKCIATENTLQERVNNEWRDVLFHKSLTEIEAIRSECIDQARITAAAVPELSTFGRLMVSFGRKDLVHAEYTRYGFAQRLAVCEQVYAQKREEHADYINSLQGVANVVQQQEQRNVALISALEKTRASNGALSNANYHVSESTMRILQTVGLNEKVLAQVRNSEFQGNDVQHYVHQQLVVSLNGISNISEVNCEVRGLLKNAVALNIHGRELNNNRSVLAALDAKEACDKVIALAKTVADLSLAAGEGVAASVTSTWNALGRFGKNVVDAGTYPEEIVTALRSRLNDAVVAISRVVTTMREDFALMRQSDTTSLTELDRRRNERGALIDKYIEALEQRYNDTPLRDKVKATAEFLTDCVLLSKGGGLLAETLCEPLLVARTQVEWGKQRICDILKCPELVVAEEVVSVGIQTIDKDPELVKAVLSFAQQDGEFATRAQESPGQRISEFVDHLEAKGARYQTLQTGEQCRISRPLDDWKANMEWAPCKYEEIRALADDVSKIAQNVNMPEFKIQRIKDHLFNEKHILRNGVDRFGPSIEIAEAWDRLYKGDFIRNDIQLLEHEYFESKFERLFKTDYDTAHAATQKPDGRPWYENT